MAARSVNHLSILGGGVAGLSVGYYAAKRQIPRTLYEAGERVGGNCATFTHGAFRFDAGAHRFHDKDPLITQEVRALLGSALALVRAPSQIYFHGRFIQFPLTPINVLQGLGWRIASRATLDLLSSRLLRRRNGRDFESVAVRAYGRTVAEAFLLGYSEKLWGIAPNRLSPQVSGQRLGGLNLRAFIREAVTGGRAARTHLDGAFYYPIDGYGSIADALAAQCGDGNVRLNARVTRVFHANGRIEALEIGARDRVEVDEVVSTLPLPVLLRALVPRPPDEILAAAQRIKFRNVILVAVFVDRSSITSNATVYFPDPSFWFTRVFEPRNRSARMAPAGQTSLVAEVPCHQGDDVWTMNDDELIRTISAQLERVGWFDAGDVVDACVRRIPFAYPMLEIGLEDVTARLLDFLGQFTNLRVSGRNGLFSYTHLHDMMRFGRDVVASYEPARSRLEQAARNPPP